MWRSEPTPATNTTLRWQRESKWLALTVGYYQAEDKSQTYSLSFIQSAVEQVECSQAYDRTCGDKPG